MHAPTWLTLLAAAALAGCTTGGSGSRAVSGGAAGFMGPAYCQTVPSGVAERDRWNRLCFGR